MHQKRFLRKRLFEPILRLKGGCRMLFPMWKIVDTGAATAAQNMALDAHLLDTARPDASPILHFYDWKMPSVTYGYFVHPDRLFHSEGLKRHGIQSARRPTGGGALFHTVDFAFSIIIPAGHPGYSENVMDNYKYINALVVDALEKRGGLLSEDPSGFAPEAAHFCMAKPTKYDVMLGGKKIAGAAQRKKRQGYLHQGSIAIALPPRELLFDVLRDAETIAPAMHAMTHTILNEGYSQRDLQNVRKELKQALASVVS